MTGKNKEWEQQAELICTPKVSNFWGAYQKCHGLFFMLA